MLNRIIPDLHVQLQGKGEAFENANGMSLSGKDPLGEVKTKAANSDYHNDESPVATKQADVASKYLKQAARVDELNGHPPESDGPMITALKKYNRARCWSS